jgi:hypothetical protein
LNLERSVGSLAKRLDRIDPVFAHDNNSGLNRWKGKPIIPLEEWIQIRNTPYALDCFPDDFDQDLTYTLEGDLNGERKQEDVKIWDSDFLELMEYTKNPNYGKLKCFHCLLSPEGDDPIFIGINRLIAKGLNNDRQENDPIVYPCRVVNRFQCPYERTNIKEEKEIESTNSHIYVEDLFRLQKMAFMVEIRLAEARKEDSEIRIKDKQDLFHALTDRNTFVKILQQSDDSLDCTEYRDITAEQDNNHVVDYFMRIKNYIDVNELRFY